MSNYYQIQSRDMEKSVQTSATVAREWFLEQLTSHPVLVFKNGVEIDLAQACKDFGFHKEIVEQIIETYDLLEDLYDEVEPDDEEFLDFIETLCDSDD